ncbi:hypothetical protein DPX16_13192 [Anabarilius grahami]|uniref:Uncharacterized protein n=1 Tax=Anabarilius grahami TaxID=495550 RepID=A0A3N0YMR1_ANAGA|nr:hypothetical protein DPX16_13192 [Anabarilius grahami]
MRSARVRGIRYRMLTGYFMLSHSSTCNTPPSRQSAKPPISNGNFTSNSRCSCDGCPTLKNDESTGALAERTHSLYTWALTIPTTLSRSLIVL